MSSHEDESTSTESTCPAPAEAVVSEVVRKIKKKPKLIVSRVRQRSPKRPVHDISAGEVANPDHSEVVQLGFLAFFIAESRL
jgi:hypothetical protein